MRVKYYFSSRHNRHIENISRQRKKFPDIVTEIISISDIILEVLDARFPEETRNLALEKEIKTRGKKLIFVINKSDLIDKMNKKEELKALNIYPHVFVSCKQMRGVRELRSKIKMEAKRIELPTESMRRVQVGVMGYPNTGKSSLINVLVRKASARVGAEAGFTKGMQKIKLTSDILILDTPGVIPRSEYSDSDPKALSKYAKVNARDYSKVRNPDFVVGELLKEYTESIEKFYGIKTEGNADLLIHEIGKRMNFLIKGGGVDEDRAARWIIKDWQNGKIKLKNLSAPK